MAQQSTKININANNELVLVHEQLPPLGDKDVRVQIVTSNINKNDISMWESNNTCDFFGTEIVGKVSAVGKNVGHCKVGQTVGVHRDRNNFKQFSTGFANHLQVDQESILYIPDTIGPEQAGLFLGSGAIAFNAVEKVIPGSSIAIVGSGHLAYLTTQFSKKMAGCNVTLFDYEGNEELAKEFGADAFIALSKASIEKHNQKFKAIIITDNLKEDEAFCIQDMAWRSGHIIFATAMAYYPKIHALDFMTGQKIYLGARRGSYGQAVKALKAAAFYNIRGKVDVIEAAKFSEAFEKAKTCKASQSIALKY